MSAVCSLSRGDRRLGVLFVDSAQPGRIDSADGELLELLDEGRFRNGVIHMHHRTS